MAKSYEKEEISLNFSAFFFCYVNILFRRHKHFRKHAKNLLTLFRQRRKAEEGGLVLKYVGGTPEIMQRNFWDMVLF
jgi:hypothetical protein